MSFFELAKLEAKEVTPETGFNICVYDSYSKLGENLTIVDWKPTQAEALKAQAEIQAEGATAYIFGKPEDELAVEETVSISSSLSNLSIGDKDRNYTATGAKVDSEPPMHNEYGFNVKKEIPEWQFPIEDYKPQIKEVEEKDDKKKRKKWLELLAPWLALIGGGAALESILEGGKLQLMARYVYHGHEFPEICESLDGKIFNLLDKVSRPVPPSEGLGYTTTHPNCKCTWEMITTARKPAKLTKTQSTQFKDVRKHIGQAARKHDLHTVNKDGSLSPRTRGTNPVRMIQESIMELRTEVPWMTDDYIAKLESLKKVTPLGRFMLIRAASEAITDHRSEGDQYRRLLAGDELHAVARTGIGKTADINHHPEYVTDTIVLDADYNQVLKQIEFLVHVNDPELISLIENQLIHEVSINGSPPRSQDVECQTDECFLVPRGVVLGEMDGIAFTWVVSAPQGITYKNNYIPHADAGVKNTAIEIL